MPPFRAFRASGRDQSPDEVNSQVVISIVQRATVDTALLAKVPGVKQDADGAFQFPCNTPAKIGLTVGGKNSRLVDLRDLRRITDMVGHRLPPGACDSRIPGNDGLEFNEMMLVATFLKNSYYVAGN
ncbi:hypothetical protein EVG20_g9753 [Dentipellis fragilis]|uniref:Peptidase A1 domain-containing protein n=1 Tax=Dentipellis fragilis TaxID=205917 RepID=A0A4Y9XW03_9AGAM|nr:hypothetical protein EVG20_g9753 [Dentipellis fragilis]